MPNSVDREEVRRLIDEGVQIVEVLSEQEYAQEHLPGAINIPLKELNRESASRLELGNPVLVYCWDYQ
jgi:rhodanese-related sulfurtransferase